MTDYDIERSWATEPAFYLAPHPPTMEPRNYQFAGAEYALGRRNALIGDAPGLGKTPEAVLISNAIEAEHTLIVCPASLRLNWEREIWRWSMIENVSTYPVLAARDGINLKSNYLIISYNLLTNPSLREAILAGMWDHLVLDEAHKLKDPRGNTITAAIEQLPPKVGRITMLSGTITPNTPIECLNAFRLLDHSAIDYMEEEDFRQFFYEKGEGMVTGKYMKTLPSGEKVLKYGAHWSRNVRNVPTNLDILRNKLRGNIMVRRLKEHVMPELPEMEWHPFPLATTPGMKRVMKHPGWAKAERLFDMDPDSFNPDAEYDGEVSTAWRLMGEEKAKPTADYCEELLREGVTKVVVGAWHKSVLAILVERLKKYGVVYMDGSTSAAKKQAAVDAFQMNPDIAFMVGQMIPLGEGWTLTAAQDVVLAQPNPTPGKNYQLFERINRYGQEGDYTLCHIPIVPYSLDERWIARAVERDQAIHETLDVRT